MGGTKSEMERLLKDAKKITGIKYNINNLSDVYEAIHVIQKELGITGTTAEEAEKTLTGSFSALKASWNNFLSGAGDLSQVVSSVDIAFENILRIVNDAIPSIINNISESLPDILKLGTEILFKIIEGITNNLPSLAETALTVVENLLNGLIDNLPKIIEAGIKVVAQLISGIAKMMPTLIPQAVNCIITIVEGLLDNLDLLIDAGLELITALTNGIIDAMPKLIEKAPEIIEKLFNAFVKCYPKIITAGAELVGNLIMGIIGSEAKLSEIGPNLMKVINDGCLQAFIAIKSCGIYLVQGLWNGIQERANWVKEKVSGFAQNILSNMKNSLGIHSPSTLFRDQVGKYIALGVGEGFEDNISKVYKQMKSAVNFETQRLSAKLSTTATMSKVLTANINVNGNVDMDSTRVGRLVAPSVAKTIKAGGLA